MWLLSREPQIGLSTNSTLHVRGSRRATIPYGDIDELLFAVIDSLNETPASISVADLFTGTRHEAILDGDTVLDLVFQSLYSEDLLTQIPEMLADLRDGSYLKAEQLISLVVANQEFFAIGQNFSVQCHEEVAYSDPDAVALALVEFPHLASLVEGAFTQSVYAFEFCEAWGAGIGHPIEADPVFSAIPTLVTAGQFDPITPPSFGRAVADRLENAYFVEYRGVGHGVAAIAGCPLSVTLAFLADPTVEPDTSCADSMSPARFTVYTGDTSVELVEVAIELFGAMAQALVPTTWTDVGFGSFYRSTSGTDETALLIQTYNDESLVEFLVDAYGALFSDDGTLAEVAVVTIGGREWRRFTAEASELRMEVAIWSGEGSTFAVAIVSEARDADGFYTSVFLPALESIRLLP